MAFRTRLSKVLFRKRSAKMTDGNEKRKRQLAFEPQSSSVFEKRSKYNETMSSRHNQLEWFVSLAVFLKVKFCCL